MNKRGNFGTWTTILLALLVLIVGTAIGGMVMTTLKDEFQTLTATADANNSVTALNDTEVFLLQVDTVYSNSSTYLQIVENSSLDLGDGEYDIRMNESSGEIKWYFYLKNNTYNNVALNVSFWYAAPSDTNSSIVARKGTESLTNYSSFFPIIGIILVATLIIMLLAMTGLIGGKD